MSDSSMPMLMIDLAELSLVAMIYLRQGGVTLARMVNAQASNDTEIH